VRRYELALIALWAYGHLAVLASGLLFVHISRVANRLSWPRISAQALCVALLLAVGVVCQFLRGGQMMRTWLLVGVGEAGLVAQLTERLGLVKAVRALSVALVLDRLQDWWPLVPLGVATLWSILLMLQLALAATFRARPPEMHRE
jgi:hypothetical protein